MFPRLTFSEVYTGYLTLFRTRILVPIPVHIVTTLCGKEELLEEGVKHGKVFAGLLYVQCFNPVTVGEGVLHIVNMHVERDPRLRYLRLVGVPYSLKRELALMNLQVIDIADIYGSEELMRVLKVLTAIHMLDPGIMLNDVDIHVEEVTIMDNALIIDYTPRNPPIKLRLEVTNSGKYRTCIIDTDICITELDTEQQTKQQ